METCVGGNGLARGFVELGAQVYADDPLWIPEEPQGLEAAFGPGNPWFARGEAETFCLPDRARLAVFREPGAEVGGKSAAFFGFWETVADIEPSRALFSEAIAWAKDRGVASLCGPINFSTFGQYRLRTSAIEGAVPFVGEPYNPAYYPALIAELGFAVRERYESRGFCQRYFAPMVAGQHATTEALLGEGYRLEHLDPGWWVAHLPQLHRDIDHVFHRNVAYTRLSWPEFEGACGEAMVGKACTRASVVALGPGGDLAGFGLTYPHYGPLVIQGAAAARVALSTLSFAEHGPQLDAAPVRVALQKTFGVLPAHRGRGLGLAIAAETIKRTAPYYNYAIAAMQRSGSILDRSVAAFRDAVDAGPGATDDDLSKTTLGGDRAYALYTMDI